MVGHALGTIGDTQRVWWDAWRVWGACTAHRDTPEGAGGRVGHVWGHGRHVRVKTETWGGGGTHGSMGGARGDVAVWGPGVVGQGVTRVVGRVGVTQWERTGDRGGWHKASRGRCARPPTGAPTRVPVPQPAVGKGAQGDAHAWGARGAGTSSPSCTTPP